MQASALRSERLVQFDHVEVGNGQPRPDPSAFLAAGTGPMPITRRVDAGHRRGNDACPVAYVHNVLWTTRRCDDERGGAVVDPAGVSRLTLPFSRTPVSAPRACRRSCPGGVLIAVGVARRDGLVRESAGDVRGRPRSAFGARTVLLPRLGRFARPRSRPSRPSTRAGMLLQRGFGKRQPSVVSQTRLVAARESALRLGQREGARDTFDAAGYEEVALTGRDRVARAATAEARRRRGDRPSPGPTAAARQAARPSARRCGCPRPPGWRSRA